MSIQVSFLDILCNSLPCKLLLCWPCISWRTCVVLLLDLWVGVLCEYHGSKLCIENQLPFAGLDFSLALMLCICCWVTEESDVKFRVVNEVLYCLFHPFLVRLPIDWFGPLFPLLRFLGGRGFFLILFTHRLAAGSEVSLQQLSKCLHWAERIQRAREAVGMKWQQKKLYFVT